ncbi:hypothetical protein TWF481_007473 [Arthrobotrys musiformis]|uniref:Uncharacterized protein n=1 Tax=Arthrobotrys musiformis TaxID=47236 RepID=A0AAV9WCK8_9PEZI
MSSHLTSSSSTGTLVEPFDSYNINLQQTPRRKSSSSHGSSVTMITTYPSNEEEFSRFPEAVRRKYFSSVERLRLTQKSNNNRLAYANATASSARPGSNSSDCYKRLSVLRHPHGHNKKEEVKPSVPPQLLLAESDALWYMRLPDSIKRKYFSKEERNILQRRCQELFPDAVADRTLYLLPPRFANRSLTTLTSHSSASINIYETTIEKDHTNFDQSYKYIDFLDRPSSRSSSLEDTTTDFSSLALPMQNFEPTPLKAAPAPVDMASRRSMRRSMSLTKNFRQSRSSFTGFVFTASAPTTRSHSHSHSLSYDAMRGSLAGTGLEHDATFWQDPDARHKLRLYLASPQNFDEAIEFGFPSLANDASTKKSEVVETVSIVTAETEEKVLNTGLRPRPATSGGVESSSRQGSRGLNVPSRLDNREMTLRMTLTRKDLRAHDDEIYGWQQPLRSPLGSPEGPLSPLDTTMPPLSPMAMVSGNQKKTPATKGWKKIWKKISHV